MSEKGGERTLPRRLQAPKHAPMRLYQLQVLAGVLVAALMEGLFAAAPTPSNGIVESLEATSILLCCAGLITGGREHRSAFEAFGRDKITARQDPAFMRARAHLQITSVAAVAAVGIVAARRYSVSDVVPLVAALALGLSLPFINRLSGWVRNN